MPATWTPEAERRLLISVITVLSPSPPKWSDVLQLMGEGYTEESIRQHYQKIRKQAKAELNDSGEPVTPKKPTPRKRTTKKNNGDKKADTQGDAKADAQSDDDEESPSKKIKVKEEGA